MGYGLWITNNARTHTPLPLPPNSGVGVGAIPLWRGVGGILGVVWHYQVVGEMPRSMEGEATMATAEQIHAAIAAAKGRVFTLVASTLPTSAKVLGKRAEIAAAKSVEGHTFSAQQTLATEEVDGGTISVVRVSGRPDTAWGGGDPIRLSKKGTQSVGFLVYAMEEYGVATACPYAIREGSSCYGKGARHTHRAYGLERITSVVVAGEEFVK